MQVSTPLPQTPTLPLPVEPVFLVRQGATIEVRRGAKQLGCILRCYHRGAFDGYAAHANLEPDGGAACSTSHDCETLEQALLFVIENGVAL